MKKNLKVTACRHGLTFKPSIRMGKCFQMWLCCWCSFYFEKTADNGPIKEKIFNKQQK